MIDSTVCTNPSSLFVFFKDRPFAVFKTTSVLIIQIYLDDEFQIVDHLRCSEENHKISIHSYFLSMQFFRFHVGA